MQNDSNDVKKQDVAMWMDIYIYNDNHHINTKNVSLLKCTVSPLQYGVILHIHVSFRGFLNHALKWMMQRQHVRKSLRIRVRHCRLVRQESPQMACFPIIPACDLDTAGDVI